MISVVTITYNNHSELLSTLSSLDGQEIESVVVNGGSDPETQKFLSTWGGTFVTEPDAGISDAFNKGITLSRGDHVLFLNSGDELIDRDYLSKADVFLGSHPEVDFVYADILLDDVLAGEVVIRSRGRLPNIPFQHPTLVVRKRLFEKIGFFDLSFRSAMDLDLIYRIVDAGARGHYIPGTVVRMNGRGISSINHSLYFKEKIRAALKNKDYSFYSVYVFSRLAVSFIVRRILLVLGMKEIVARYRRIKHQ